MMKAKYLPKFSTSLSFNMVLSYRLWHAANLENAFSNFSDTCVASESSVGSLFMAVSIIEWQRVSVFLGYTGEIHY